MHEKGSFNIYLEINLSHMNVFKAHTIEHIQVKDFINMQQMTYYHRLMLTFHIPYIIQT